MTKTYEVGYKRPPKHARWAKGQSGNPRGRAKGTRNLVTELSEELGERIPVREQGKSHSITKQRAVIKALTARAVQGDARAANLLLNMIIRLAHLELPVEPDAPIAAEDATIVEAFLKRRASSAKDGT